MDFARYLPLACELADLAGEIVRRHFRRPLAVEIKGDLSPVTIADREAEAAMRRRLAEAAPDHAIFGEEYGDAENAAGLAWCLDPIDGTKAFLTGRPMFGTLVALLADGAPVLAVIDQPITRDRWTAVRGGGARFNGRRVHSRACPELARAAASATSPDMFTTPRQQAALALLRRSVALMVWGGDCIGYALMASGFCDLVIEAGLKTYDFLPLVPVIEEAGGRITDWQGRPLSLASGGEVLACGDPKLHEAVLTLLRDLPAAGTAS